MRLTISALILGIIFLLNSCSDDEASLKITSIYPEAGVAGMQVTILGKGFQKKPEKNIIKFNGVKAEIISATATSLIAIVPEGTSGLVTLEDKESNGLSFRYYDVFILANKFVSENSRIDVWKNEAPISITDGSAFTRGWAFTVANDAIYVAGDIGISVVKPAYWKNTQIYPLSIDEERGTTNGIAVNNDDVYVSGIDATGAFESYFTKLWKNGNPLELKKEDHFTFSNSLLFDQGHIYIGGGLRNSSGGSAAKPVYWKDGGEVLLPDQSGDCFIVDMAVQNSDVYALGQANEGNVIMYWKNGVEIPFTNTVSNYGNSIAVAANNDIYVAGVNFNLNPQATLWKNGISESVLESQEGIKDSNALRVIAKDGNVIIMGVVTTTNNETKTFLKVNEYFHYWPLSTDGTTTAVDLFVH